MNDLIIIFDAVGYEVFRDSYAINLKKLGKLCKAYSLGRNTVSSMAAILSGYLPYSEYGQIYDPGDIFWSKSREGYFTAFFYTNVWVHWLASAVRGVDLSSFYNGVEYRAETMVKHAFQELSSRMPFFSIIFFTDTHGDFPSIDQREVYAYNRGEEVDGIVEEVKSAQMRAVEKLDRAVRPLLSLKNTRIIFTSDHGALLGEHHRIGHDPSYPWHVKLIEVPLIIGESHG